MEISNLTSVYVKSTKEIKTIRFSSPDKPEVSDVTLEKWQSLVNNIIKLVDVKAALVNKLGDGYTQILIKSDNEANSYIVGSTGKLCIGTYCEEVLGNNLVLNVENANYDPIWSDSIYIKPQIISYYGLPLLWPDGEFFGTLCALDNKPHVFSEELIQVFDSIKNAIEHDLFLIQKQHELVQLTHIDPLTSLENRRSISKHLEYIHSNSHRTASSYCIVMIDIDYFKEINDLYGHQMGDQVLKTFADSLKENTRNGDVVGRYGGDEFTIIFPHTTLEDAELTMNHLADKLSMLMIDNSPLSYSYGIACSETYTDPQKMIAAADSRLYEMKQQHHHQNV